jgi:NAD(P)-dependent dehydrogenase (short-subunit alcohol dehydrogenase family)
MTCVVVITGALGHLGRAVSAELAARGTQLVLLDRVPGAAALAAQSAFAAPAAAQVTAQVDLTSLPDVRAALDAAARRWGGIDALVNIAGGFQWQTLAASDDLAEWRTLFELNVMTCATACKAALPHLQRRGGGRIVNVGAFAAARGTSGMGAYAASKSGVARLTEALADELKGENITVNAVLPSIIDTPANRAAMPKADPSRWVRAEQIAQVVGFLLSDAAAAVTGALVPVTGRG